MLEPGISVQYGTASSSSFPWATVITGLISTIVAAGAAILSAWLVNRHQTILQDSRLRAEAARANLDAKRLHGEELYRLFDEWISGLLDDVAKLVNKYGRQEALTAEDAELTVGDHAKYQRIILLAHLDYPMTKAVMDDIGKGYINMRLASVQITTANLQSEAIDTISDEHYKLMDSGDRFRVVLLTAIMDLYGSNNDTIGEAPKRIEINPSAD